VTHRVVVIYDADNEIDIDGRTYPGVCLLEDSDGIRFLFLARRGPIESTLWIKAHTDGAQAIVCGDPLSFVLGDFFADERQGEHVYSIDDRWWVPSSSVLDYYDMSRSGEDQEDVTGLVHLHVHTEFSALDGLSSIKELLDAVEADEQKAVAVSDHGNCAAHPALQLEARKRGIKPIFGMETYFVDDRFDREAANGEYWHLVLWAMDDEGLKNLWAMSTEAYREGLHYKPRLDWDTLERLNKGVMASTACLGGPVLNPWLKGEPDKGEANLSRLKAIFGDRLYVELHANHLEEQIRGNRWIQRVAREQNVPLVAVADSHYATKEDSHTHRTWLSVQTNKDVQDDTTLFAGDQEYHLLSEQEMRAALSYLPADLVDEAIKNTVRVANRCSAEIVGRSHNPVYSRITEQHPDPIQHDVERLIEICMQRWDKRLANKQNPQQEYIERFEHEMALIIEKQFCGYFLMVWDQVIWAKNNGILVGPSRGSGGGSLVAYLMGITEIDPVQHDLLFERFINKGRQEMPDFDMDYPSSKKIVMLDYIRQRWGEDHVAIVGTHLRLKNKGAIRNTATALKSVLTEKYGDYFGDVDAVSNLIEEAEAGTAGLGLSWEDLWIQAGFVLDPYKQKYPELFEMAEKLVWRLKTYSRHAAGVIIDPDQTLTGALPLRNGDVEGAMVTQFDKDTLELLGYIKFDLLNISTLDTLQGTVDLIEEKTHQRVVVYDWIDEYEDPQIFEELCEGWTLGIFQIETSSGTRLVKRFQPRSVADLAAILTLVRPGPTRSGLTDTYLRRRHGEEEVILPDPRLIDVLGKTYGCMVYQEDIMNVCMAIGGYDSVEADEVRKILGKKKVELVAREGERFIRRAIANNTDRDVAKHLWEQMAEFAKYTFPKAHAFAYAIITAWSAWFKFHYTVPFLASALSTVKPEHIPTLVEEVRRMGYKVLPPDINESGVGFTAVDMGVRYGLESVKGIAEASSTAILQARPFTSWEDFQERQPSKFNVGHAKTLVHIGAFDTLLNNRRGLEALMEQQAIPSSLGCVFRSPEGLLGDHGLPCEFPWDTEPVEIGRTGKPKKPKPLPKKCTRACRQFTPPAPIDPLTVPPYTDAQIRAIELEVLGVWLSSTPFDDIPPEDRAGKSTAVDVLTGPMGTYAVAVLIKNVRLRVDRYGNRMCYLTCGTERGDLDCVVFNREFEKHQQHFKPGSLAFAVLKKNDRGQTLDSFIPLSS
jgi:DNA polymerase III subunit alpha